MAAALTDYTTHDEIRAALGVSDEDLESATLALDLYANLLEAELEDIKSDLPTTYATTKLIAVPTAAETRFLQSANVFATFCVAKQLTASLPLFAARQVTDSKAAITRFDNPYKDVIASVNAQYEKSRSRLAAAMAAIGSSASALTTRVFLSVVSPATDPVTNS